MKKTKMALAGIAVMATALLSFHTSPASSIKGKVTPERYAVHAWAISETDTLYTTVTDGYFEFPNAKPGAYRIVVEALSPYRHMAKNDIVVNAGKTTDLGELPLSKYVTVLK